MAEVRRGDRLVWRHDEEPDKPVYIEVTRVARDRSWADLRYCTWAVSWTKRQPLPLPAGVKPCRWTVDDLDRDAAAFFAVHLAAETTGDTDR